MTPLLRKLLRMNWVILILMLALATFGVFAIYSCTYMRESANYNTMWHKQAGWIAFGTVIFLILSLTDYRWVRWGALPIYGVSMVFLILTFTPLGVLKDGARCWLRLGPLVFQPAQLAVLGGILIVALFLTQFIRLHPMIKLLACGVITGAPALLILIQPDLGECLIWIPVVFAMLFVGQIPKRYLIVVILIMVTCMPVAYYFKLKQYQRERIIAFLDPEIDANGAAWAVNQTMIAIGSGGWNGKGFKAPNTQVELGYVPQTTVPNDYIFAAVGEQWGFLGGAAVVCTLGVLIASCLVVAVTAADQMGTLIAAGVATLLFSHTYENIGMCISMMPVTGVPLPLISYSGSFVAVIMFSLGLVNSVWVHRKELPELP
ncbi:MAG: FtsW/RodA/SpoVE family cell cycle protein [Chthoniobacteraceae bacterium]